MIWNVGDTKAFCWTSSEKRHLESQDDAYENIQLLNLSAVIAGIDGSIIITCLEVLILTPIALINVTLREMAFFSVVAEDRHGASKAVVASKAKTKGEKPTDSDAKCAWTHTKFR